MRAVLGIGVVGVLLYSLAAFSGDRIPDCKAGSRVLPVINEQVLFWKRSTKNQFKDRARVKGVVSRVFPIRGDHNHFEIKIGPNANDTLEVIYNNDFGALPEVESGMDVEACGDYITSNAPSRYPASPSGAIIHWIHGNPSNEGHEHGYLVIEGILYGFDYTNARRPGRRPNGIMAPHSFPSFIELLGAAFGYEGAR